MTAMTRRIPFLFVLVFLFAYGVMAQEHAHVKAAVASNVYPVQEGFVDAKGVMIYYKIIGKGAPLMIVHGGPGASHDYFLPYLLFLARGANFY